MPGDLALIKAEALADEPKPAEPGAAPGGPAPLTDEQQIEAEAREWAEIPATFGAVVTMKMPELQDTYTDEACMEWGRAMVPIARKYQWKAGAGMTWLKLAGVTLALAKPTVEAIVARRKAEQKRQPDAPGGQRVERDVTPAASRGQGTEVKFS